MSPLERVAWVGFRHRFDVDAAGSASAKRARVGLDAWSHVMNDPHVLRAHAGDAFWKSPAEFVWGGFVVAEDTATRRDEIVFTVDGREVGRITGLRWGEAGPGEWKPADNSRGGEGS